MRRTATLLLLVLLVAIPATAFGQAVPTTTPSDPVIPAPTTGAPTVDPFNPIAPAQPTATPTPEPAASGDDGVGRNTLYAILGGVLVILFVVGWAITRDARKAAPVQERAGGKDDPLLAPAERARRARSKKQRQKHKAARAARKRTTRRR